jgi:hypothetical protein
MLGQQKGAHDGPLASMKKERKRAQRQVYLECCEAQNIEMKI